MMVNSNIEIGELAETYKKGNASKIPGSLYFPYVVEIMALRSLGVGNRRIASFLNEKIPSEIKLSSNYLSTIISRWKASGLLDGKEIEIKQKAHSLKTSSEIKDEIITLLEKMDSLEGEVAELIRSFIKTELNKRGR